MSTPFIPKNNTRPPPLPPPPARSESSNVDTPPAHIDTLKNLTITVIAQTLQHYPSLSFEYLPLVDWEFIMARRAKLHVKSKNAAKASSQPSLPILPIKLLASIEANSPHLQSAQIDSTIWRSLVDYHFPAFGADRPKELLEPFPNVVKRLADICSEIKSITATSSSIATKPGDISKTLMCYFVAMRKIPISTQMIEESKAGRTLAKFVKRFGETKNERSSFPFVTDAHVAIAVKLLSDWKTLVSKDQEGGDTATSSPLTSDSALLCTSPTWKTLYRTLQIRRNVVSIHGTKMKEMREKILGDRKEMKAVPVHTLKKRGRHDEILMGSQDRAKLVRQMASAEPIAMSAAQKNMKKIRSETQKVVQRRSALPSGFGRIKSSGSASLSFGAAVASNRVENKPIQNAGGGTILKPPAVGVFQEMRWKQMLKGKPL
jgi:hypothetical protein